MIKNKKIIMVLFITIILLSLINLDVFALSISPAKKEVKYEAGKSDSGSFIISNNDGVPLKITVKGDKIFSDISKINNQNLNPGNTILVNYKIKHPKQIGYGDNCYPITIKSLRKNQGGALNAQLNLVYQYCIFVPYPGEYANIKSITYYPKPAQIGKNNTLVILVSSKGTSEIKNAYIDGTIDCKDSKINFKTTSKDILPESTVSFNTQVKIPNTKNNQCNLITTLHYKNKVKKKQTYIIISKKEIEVVNLKREFTHGKIQQFYVMLLNKWYKTIKDVQAILTIETPEGDINIKTVPDSIKPLRTKTLFGTYTSKFLKVGTYNATLKIIFTDPEQYSKIQRYTIKVVPYDVNDINPITGGASGVNEGSKFSVLLLTNILIVIIAIIFITIILIRKKENPDSEL